MFSKMLTLCYFISAFLPFIPQSYQDEKKKKEHHSIFRILLIPQNILKTECSRASVMLYGVIEMVRSLRLCFQHQQDKMPF